MHRPHEIRYLPEARYNRENIRLQAWLALSAPPALNRVDQPFQGPTNARCPRGRNWMWDFPILRGSLRARSLRGKSCHRYWWVCWSEFTILSSLKHSSASDKKYTGVKSPCTMPFSCTKKLFQLESCMRKIETTHNTWGRMLSDVTALLETQLVFSNTSAYHVQLLVCRKWVLFFQVIIERPFVHPRRNKCWQFSKASCNSVKREDMVVFQVGPDVGLTPYTLSTRSL
jgi:hypothetical protein